jgi:hypothetical protein
LILGLRGAGGGFGGGGGDYSSEVQSSRTVVDVLYSFTSLFDLHKLRKEEPSGRAV